MSARTTLLLSAFGLIVGVGIVLLAWIPIVEIAFTFGLGQDPAFDFGDGYELSAPKMNILHWPSPNRETHGFEKVVSGPVENFALIDRWILGSTEQGWFAINKESHEVYRTKQKDEIEAATNIDLETVKMETDPWPYVIVKPQALAARKTATDFCWAMLFVIPTIFTAIPVVIYMALRGRPPQSRHSPH